MGTVVRALDASDMARLEALGRQLRRQAADIAAAEYRWLVALEEFDRDGGFALEGAKSVTEWLSWACGVSGEAARERVRVARALPGLPLVSARFAEGRVSYSKVRAVTRVATPDNEEVLVTYACHATAAQLEAVVRGFRQVRRRQDQEQEEEGAPNGAAELAHRERRGAWWWPDAAGYVRISARLPADDGMLVVRALESVADDLAEQPAEPDGPAGDAAGDPALGVGDRPVASKRWQTPEPGEVRRADALRVLAETTLAHGPAQRAADERYQVVVVVRDDDHRACAHHEPGGRDANLRADEGPAVPRAGDPAVAAALGAAATEEAAAPTDSVATEKAAAPTDAAATDGSPSADPALPRAGRWLPPHLAHLADPAGPPTALPGEPSPAPEPYAHIIGGPALSEETVRRISCDASVVALVEDALGRPLGVGRQTRAVPRRLRRALMRRDHGCRFPGCATTRHVDAHHVWHWALGGPTELDNLVLVCRFHHTLLHEGNFSIGLLAPGRFTFHRPDGTVLEAAAPCPSGDLDRLAADNLNAGVAPTADSLIPDWDGTRQDIGAAVEALAGLPTRTRDDDADGVSAETSRTVDPHVSAETPGTADHDVSAETATAAREPVRTPAAAGAA